MAPETQEKVLKALKEWRMFSREVAGFVIFVGFFAALFLLSSKAIPVENRDPVLLLLGILGSAFQAVVGFQWGGSVGSEKKSETIAKVAES